ncbi:hypothetical protein DAD186_19780 [Dermabacter vaginalis]|uniref:Uncharacterized protein n=1 Tax=Dermabacter vaginalis TaxID=1630135 RepID=A0A1B0ZKW6_9MICO|nr:hypothetical protein DAD186_19780 [Dermabacter vaginalis]
MFQPATPADAVVVTLRMAPGDEARQVQAFGRGQPVVGTLGALQ